MTASLRFRLLLLIVVAMLPLLVLIMASANTERMDIVDTVQADALRFTRLVADKQNSYIDATREILFTLAQLPAVQAHNLAVCNPLLADLLKQYPIFSNIFTVDINGGTQCSALPAAVGGINIASESWFQQALGSGDFVLGNYRLGQLTNKPIIPIARPLLDKQGKPIGLVGVGLSLDWLGDFVKRTELPEGGTLTILDNDGNLLALQPTPEGVSPVGSNFAASPIFQEEKAHKEGVTRGPGMQGVPRLFGYTHIGDDTSGIYVIVSVPEDIAFADVNNFLLRSLVTLALVTVLALFIGWMGSDLLLLRPIARLIELAKRLGTGNLSTRVAPLGISELDMLGSSLNDMARLLELRQTELTTSNQELMKEIEERRQAERENELKTQFLGMVSHELRTPLTSIKGFVSTLLADDVNWERESQQSFLRIVDEETDKLTDLVNQLLDLAQIQAGTLRIEREPQTLEQVLHLASTQLATLTHVHTLEIDIPPNLPTLDLDGARVAQVIINLVGNAARYSPPNSTIRIQAHALPDVVKITVSDEGHGIPRDQREEIFEAFRQIDRKDGTHGKGAGLGLAICKGIVESHGGRIWIADSAVGTTVAFTLPLAPMAAVEEN